MRGQAFRRGLGDGGPSAVGAPLKAARLFPSCLLALHCPAFSPIFVFLTTPAPPPRCPCPALLQV